MKKVCIAMAIFLAAVAGAGPAHADLDIFLSGLNIEARTDLDGFSARLSAQFGVPLPRVRTVIRAVDNPGDAFLCFQLSQMTGRRVETVVHTYRRHRGQGWGEIAKELGIKPGSAEFHALKRGDFTWAGGGPDGKPGRDNGKKNQGKGKSKGHK